MLTTAPVEPTEIDSKESLDNTAGSDNLTDVSRPGSELILPAGDQENELIKPCADEGTESKCSSLEAASSSCSADLLLVPSEEAEGQPERLNDIDQPSASDSLLDPLTGEKTP